jgi:hypothetical protein
MTHFTKEQVEFIIRHLRTINSVSYMIQSRDERKAAHEGRVYFARESFAEIAETTFEVIQEITSKEEAKRNDS